MLCIQQIGKLIRHRGPRIGIAVAILLVSVSVANAYLYSQSSTSITWESGTGWSNSAGGPHSPGSSDIVYIGNGAVVSVQGTDAGSALTVGTSGVNGAGVGTLNINSGSLAIGSTVNIGTASNSGTINDAATLTATTATNVNLGTLKVTGSLTSPTTTIASGGSLTGTGTVTSAVTENAGAISAPAAASATSGCCTSWGRPAGREKGVRPCKHGCPSRNSELTSRFVPGEKRQCASTSTQPLRKTTRKSPSRQDGPTGVHAIPP